MKTSQCLTVLAGVLALTTLAFAGETRKSETATYPLDTCVVSGEKLGDMGKPYVHKFEGREVRFCCKSCLKDFNTDPKKYLNKLSEAEKSVNK